MRKLWRKGESGNPKGRTPGSRNKRTELLRSAQPKLLKKLVKMAMQGDPSAMKLCIDRLVPRLRSEALPIRVREPAADLAGLGQQVIALIAAGKVAPDVGGAALGALASQAQIVEFTELVGRIERLEAQQRDESWNDGQRIGAQQLVAPPVKAKLPHRHRGKPQ